jgi:hypothetical protein
VKTAQDWTVKRGPDFVWVAKLGDVEASGVTRPIACQAVALRLQLVAIGGAS